MMKNLLIDIGNSFCKVAIADGMEILWVERMKKERLIPFLKERFPQEEHPAYSVLSSVSGYDPNLKKFLEEFSTKGLLSMDQSLKTGITNNYKTPTLGSDRLAGAVGAHYLYPDCNCMVFDFGTAITIDFVSAKGEFLGGNISPGFCTRFLALNQYTVNLPLLRVDSTENCIGTSTRDAIGNGVNLGIMFEIEGYMRLHSDKKVIFTGGDSRYFAAKTNHPVVVEETLVLLGLAQIAMQYEQ